jgi:hypothetical protein
MDLEVLESWVRMDGCVGRAFWRALPSLFEATELMKSEPESLGMELTSHEVTDRIVTLRGVQVMLDRDLADFYGVKPIRLREQVKRNGGRFPADFMFQLTEDEALAMVSQIAIPSWQQLGGSLPYAFTEQGVAALSAVLRSERAVEVSVRIARAFVSMRRLLQHQGPLFQRLETVELKQLEADEKFHQIFNALEARDDKRPRQGVFYNGQIFDAYAFVVSLIKQAKSSLVLVDNYVDESVLLMLSKRGPEVSAAIYMQKVGKRLELDLQKHAAQYPAIEVKCADRCHDRFLIIDGRELYHIGASLKDLGKSCFAFSRMDGLASEILQRLGRG